MILYLILMPTIGVGAGLALGGVARADDILLITLGLVVYLLSFMLMALATGRTSNPRAWGR